jgi:hypothetical protein
MLPSPCSNEHYQARMATAIEAAKAAGVDAIAFGDLFLQDVRARQEGGRGRAAPVCHATGGLRVAHRAVCCVLCHACRSGSIASE